MTAVISRIAPSPVPLDERTTGRDVSHNPWVRSPQPDELLDLFGISVERVQAPADRRPRPRPHRPAR